MQQYNRRDIIKIGLGALAGSMLPLETMAAVLKKTDTKRTISLHNIHTNEDLTICYCDNGRYLPQSLEKINHILRDHRTNRVKAIDTELIDILYTINKRIRPTGPFSIISGYRCPATNEMLRRSTSGVAKKSFHTKGMAIDIRLPGYNTRRLRDLCIEMKTGGVGYYSRSDFVHVDVGPVRCW